MNSEEISKSGMELLKNKKETGKENVVVKNKKLALLGGKKVCIGMSIVGIIAIWIIILTPLFAITVATTAFNQTTFFNNIFDNTISNLLPPINISTNYSNFTIERVECVDDFVYVPGDEMCYPGCDWNPIGDDSVRVVRLILNVFSVFSILLCTTTLLVWLVISCFDLEEVSIPLRFPASSHLSVYGCIDKFDSRSSQRFL